MPCVLEGVVMAGVMASNLSDLRSRTSVHVSVLELPCVLTTAMVPRHAWGSTFASVYTGRDVLIFLRIGVGRIPYIRCGVVCRDQFFEGWAMCEYMVYNAGDEGFDIEGGCPVLYLRTVRM